MKKVSYQAVPDPQVGDSDIVFYKLQKVVKYWIFTFKFDLTCGTEEEMTTAAKNLTKILETKKQKSGII